MPQPYLVLDADLTIVAASDAYLRTTDRTRECIVGRHILEAFPENPEAAGTVEQGPLEVSLRHVLDTAAIPRQRRDIPSLFVSGNLDEKTRAPALEWEPIGLVGKPYSEREVLAAIASETIATRQAS